MQYDWENRKAKALEDLAVAMAEIAKALTAIAAAQQQAHWPQVPIIPSSSADIKS